MRVSERFDLSEPRVCAFASTLAQMPGFRTIRGRLFFGTFLLAKQKKGTRLKAKPIQYRLRQLNQQISAQRSNDHYWHKAAVGAQLLFEW